MVVPAAAAAPLGVASGQLRPAKRNLPAATQANRALAGRIDPLLDAPPFDRASWGIAILDPQGRLAYARNAERLFVPASAAKLVVAATAAALLPDSFAFHTSVYTADTAADSVVHGDLVLYGRGDPTLGDRFYPRPLTALEMLADSLRARGITRVAGDLVGDASYFDSVTIAPSWESYDLMWWYAAPITALAWSENVIDVGISPGAPGFPPFITTGETQGLFRLRNLGRTVPPGSPRTFDFHRTPGTNDVWASGDLPSDARPWTDDIAVADGPLWAITAFRRALAERGITVSGAVRTTFDSTDTYRARLLAPLADLASPPLGEVLEPILRLSHNWYAELLLRTLGKTFLGQGSFQAGIAVERRFLVDSLGVDSAGFDLVDASGLSHHDLMSPLAFVTLLRGIRDHPPAQRFLDALAAPGSAGTLQNRFRAVRVRGQVRAKTGSIANTNSLIGYLEGRGGRTWTFAIMLGNHDIGTRDVLRQIDNIVAAIR